MGAYEAESEGSMRILIASLVAAAALVASYPAAACGDVGPVVETPREDPATLRVQAARLDATAAAEEAQARALDAQHDSLLVRARQLDALAIQRAEPERTQLVAQAIRMEELAAQAQARATQMRMRSATMRRQALQLRQRAAQLAGGGGGWRRVPTSV